MNLKKTSVLPVFLFMASFSVFAKEVKLGNDLVTYTLTCGKAITVSFTDLTDYNSGHTLIGLKNKQTGAVDLFLSRTPTSDRRQYEQYNRVIYDNLSKTYIEMADSPSIVWGAARDNGQTEETYRLALGPHVYICGKLEKLPDETANTLYGEVDDGNPSEGTNATYGQ